MFGSKGQGSGAWGHHFELLQPAATLQIKLIAVFYSNYIDYIELQHIAYNYEDVCVIYKRHLSYL